MMAIDLRSDTVTRPTAPMREAMAAAPVGDDVFGEDPTVNQLEQRAAALLGTERALYVPSGSMANQIALLTHCRPGDDVIIGHGAHSYLYESGASGAVAGVQFTIVGRGGLFDADEARAAIKPDDHHYAPTRLLMAENTHNRGGGRIFPFEWLNGLRALADERDLRLHIDGARLLNAAIASGTEPSAYGRIAHSLSLCLSKGLGAPVGSVLAGSAAIIDRAHRYRKMLGGGMRQAGIIAAGGLYALDHHVERLADDHRRARRFAEGVAGIDGLRVDPDTVETNIVFFEVDESRTSPQELEDTARELGLLFLAHGPRQIRAVFHLDVAESDVDDALEILRAAMEVGE